MLLVRDGQVFLWKNGIDSKLSHDAPYQFPAYFYAVFIVKREPHSPLTTSGIFSTKFINLIYQIELLLRNNRPMIKVATTYSEHGTLADDWHPVVF